MNNKISLQVRVHADHVDPLINAGLLAELARHPGIEVVPGTATLDPSQDAVIVTDLEPAMQWLLRLSEGPGRPSRTRVVALTANDRLKQVREALAANIHGYIVQGSSVEELVDCVRTVGRGSRYLCRVATARMADSYTFADLTKREYQVLQCMANGDCNKTIARSLDIAVGTVKAHVKGILNKLEATGRTQAVTVAASRGLIDGSGFQAGRPLS